MILDEIHVRNMTHEDTTYIALVDLTHHLACAAHEFYAEAQAQGYSRDEMIYTIGIANGIAEVVRFLAQSGLESHIERKVNTVADFMDWNS
jgi:hypothetical protein